jgi:xylulokinase
VGGGSKSSTLLELKATVLKRPVSTLENPEAALLGCAMLAQVAVGSFAGLEEARRECVRIARTVEPRADIVEAYSAAFDRFRQLYGTLKSFYHNWRSEWRTAALA